MTIPLWFDDKPLEDLSEDLLGFAAPAQRLASSLDRFWSPSRDNALAVSLEGPWGSGKTSFANMVVQRLLAQSAKGPPIVVRFNVWQSGSMDLSEWSALAYRLGEALYKNIHRVCMLNVDSGDPILEIGTPESCMRRDRLERLGASLRLPCKDLADPRLHWIEVATRIAQLVPSAHWHPALSLFCDAPTKIPGRGRTWQDSKRGVTQLLLSGAEAALTGRFGSLGRAAESALEDSQGRPPIQGPTWGVDSLEFVKDLGLLLQIMRPEAIRWRAVIVVDDVTRLKEAELPQVLDALGYLRELRDVLVLVNLDNQCIEMLRELAPPRWGVPENKDTPGAPVPMLWSSQREDFLTKLVNVRHPVPRVPLNKLGRLAHEWWTVLGLPPAWEAGSDANPTRRLVAHGVTTPRQFKRALQWMWLRLSSVREGQHTLWTALQQRALSPKRLEAVLALLVDLHLYGEERLSGSELMERVGAEPALLLEFDAQPWDGCDWEDRHFRVGALQAHAPTQRLLEVLRLHALALHAQTTREEEGDVAVWRAWSQAIQAEDAPALQPFGDIVDGEGLVGLTDHLLTLAQGDTFSALLQATFLGSVARQFGLVQEVTELTLATLLCWWWDGDVLFRAIIDPQESDETLTPEARLSIHIRTAAAWLLLSVLHPTIVRPMAVDLKGSVALEALGLTEMVEDIWGVFQVEGSLDGELD